MNVGNLDHLIVVSHNNKKHPVDLRVVVKIKSDGEKTSIHLLNNRILTFSQNLKHFEDLLKPFFFLKISKHCLVNYQYLEGMKPGKTAKALLSDGSEEKVSRLYRKHLAAIFDSLN